MDGRNPFRTTLKPWLKLLLVGIYRGIMIPGFLRRCRISSIHSRDGRRPLLSFRESGEGASWPSPGNRLRFLCSLLRTADVEPFVTGSLQCGCAHPFAMVRLDIAPCARRRPSWTSLIPACRSQVDRSSTHDRNCRLDIG